MDSLIENLQGIDIDAALTYCMGEEAILKKALVSYANVIPSKIEKITKLWQDHDIPNYTIEVHALKSSSRAVGATDLSQKAAYLEKCGDDNNIEEIDAKTPELLELYTSYITNLAPLLAPPAEVKQKKQIENEQVTQAWSAIREFVEVFDYPRAEEVLHMLDEYQLNDEQQAKYATVKKLLQDINHDELLAVL